MDLLHWIFTKNYHIKRLSKEFPPINPKWKWNGEFYNKYWTDLSASKGPALGIVFEADPEWQYPNANPLDATCEMLYFFSAKEYQCVSYQKLICSTKDIKEAKRFYKKYLLMKNFK